MLSFAALVPHPPLLIPLFEKKEGAKLAKTVKALKQIEQDLYLTKPETIIIITPHAKSFDDAFTTNIHDKCHTDYNMFGDISTKQEYPIDIMLASRVREMCDNENIQLQTVSTDTIDHGAGVPLQFLASHLPNIKILPIGISEKNAKEHFDFGYLIKKVIMESDKRIAVICSADLSHALITDSPAGFHKEGEEFDKKIQEVLTSGNTSSLLQMDDEFIKNASTCGYKPIVTILGMLQRIDYSAKVLSYESPFGVGYLVVNFVL